MNLEPHRILPRSVVEHYVPANTKVTFVAKVQNLVYCYRDTGGERILRLTPESHRPVEQVAAEIDWVRDLVLRGAPVAAPLPSTDGRFWRRVEMDGVGYTLTVFET